MILNKVKINIIFILLKMMFQQVETELIQDNH